MSTRQYSLEWAWTLLADGLQTHRHYLSVEPLRERYVAELHQKAEERRGAPLPALADLRARFGDAVLAHLLHPAQSADWPHHPPARVPATVSLAGTPVVVRRTGHLAGCDGIVHGDTLLDGEPDLEPDYARAVDRCLGVAGLGFLVPLCAEVIVHGGPPPSRRPPGTVYLAPPQDSPVQYGLRLVAAAARALVSGFAASGPTAVEPDRTWDLGPGTGTLRRDAAAEQILESGLCLRYLTAHARPLEAVLDEVAEAFSEVNTADLLTTSFPGGQRFAKYTDGGGAGQH
ncbi:MULTISPECIES: hypothetical protein [unclassified Streptomyces]|uniref:hypothetical protein n=1 Tax=unclassified Streptomyces TaxID=2593676 RepID=UPI0004C0CC65|nr:MULTISPECIES: hypothetical protein [unclassified Streptomyces]